MHHHDLEITALAFSPDGNSLVSASGSRECARKLAYQEVTYAESLRMPLVLLGAEFVHQTAMPRELSAEQQEVVWTAADKIYLASMEDKLQTPQFFSLLLTWKGTTNFLGWGGLAPNLDPALRGALAYVIGQRYLLRLQKPAEALTFFQTALRDAPPNSALARLAQAEVDRLKKAK